MKKSEVYSWRLSTATKTALEDEARREGTTVSGLLERMTREWMARRRLTADDDAAEQVRLHERARQAIGTINGGLPPSTSVREVVRARLKRRHGR